MRAATLLQSTRYKSFVAERDKALEAIHENAQVDLSRITFDLLTQLEGVAASHALRTNQSVLAVFHLSQTMEAQTLEICSRFIYPIADRIERMRKAAFTLANLSELEAIGQATKRAKPQSGFGFKQKIEKQTKKKTLTDEQLEERVWIALMRLRADILDAFRLALIQRLNPQQILAKVRAQFPSVKIYKKRPRALKSLREAARIQDKDKLEISTDFIDEDDWEHMIQAYQDTELPPSRFDQGAEYDPETSTMTYNWEFEQDLTDDFVQQVRDGQIDAANELGIRDFVWVAIIDDKTCEVCCLPRNGMTTQEIEAALASGKLDADECDATSPPAHPHCRCNIAPVASVDEVEGPDWKSFKEWLDT